MAPADVTPTPPATPARTPAPARIDRPTTLGDGPRQLGRNVVVHSPTDVPPSWADAPHRAITATVLADPVALVAELRHLALTALRCVFVIAPDVAEMLNAAAHEVDLRPIHQLGPRFTFHLEALHHLVWANSVDARTPDQPAWSLLDQAVALGATAVDAATSVGTAPGDVLLSDGTPAWLDGGPVRYSAPIQGIPVLHRVAIQHGSLQPFGIQPCAADLAPDQLAAVTHTGGAARIIAPAGSGKTRVLTERARHLLCNWKLPAPSVCLVAFNKRAQEEMRARTTDLPGLQVRTLNAIALAIVNGSSPFAPRPQQVRTLDEGDVRRIIGALVAFPRKRNADPVAPWIEALSLARLGLRDPADVEATYEGEVDGFQGVLPHYRAELARSGAVDFDEQVFLALHLLLTDATVRATAQLACRVLLVDEFQDLTPAHLLLVRLLAGPDAAVFGVGDDDQTIYGYNGADPAWLIEFAQLFPGAGEHPLEVNYRCPEGIVAAADMLLRHNQRRVPKTIRAGRHGAHGWSVITSEQPVAAMARQVTDAIAAGTPPAHIAVLTRVNSLLAPVQVALGAAGVPVSGGVGAEFAERTAVRATLAWLRLITAGSGDRFSSADLAEALRRPSRPLHPNVATWVTEQTSVDGLRRLASRLNAERDAERVQSFADDIERLQRLATTRGTTAQILATLRDSVGLASAVATLDVHRHGMNRAAQNDDLTAIAQLAEMQPDPGSFEPWLRDALRHPWRADGVTLATVHRVKGQEWPMVVVHHAEDDQFPHRLAEDLEEERRLFHVAITRASREAVIVVGPHPSPFIHELTNEPPARQPNVPAVSPSRRTAPAAAPRTSPTSRPGEGLLPADAVLFEALRAARRHLAAGKPAYTVFSDATLEQIAIRRPSTLAELAAVRGVGPTKLDQYGAAILVVVEDAGA